ncbi:MAG: tetratricopeptide repeat protein [Bacteroidia bacterium]|nr:tetratricopeptide repeat protein [Bacteroidia bacterium]
MEPIINKKSNLLSGVFQREADTIEKRNVILLLSSYFILSLIWGIVGGGTWDDDCPTRYYYTLGALNDPEQFISLWNRPLFTLLFFIPVHLGKHAMLVLMTLISASCAFMLYRSSRELKIPNSYLVIPFLLFQPFFFAVSRNLETEQLAATIISFGLFFAIRKKYLAFAIIGSLLPLARIELSPLLVLWAYFLWRNNPKRLSYILILGVPTLLWNLAGFFMHGDFLWLLHQTVGKESIANRYGHQPFEHYFQKYIYILSPFVFFFFFTGLTDRIFKRKISLLTDVQFVIGFMLYVVIAWKVNMGSSAGFLRNLLPVSPLAALIALHGYNLWKSFAESFLLRKADVSIKENFQNIVADKKLQKRFPHQSVNVVKSISEKQKAKRKSGNRKSEGNLLFSENYMLLFSMLLLLTLSYIFFSKQLEMHHKFSTKNDYTNIIVIGSLFVFFLSSMFFRKNYGKAFIAYIFPITITLSLMSFTLITENPDSNMSPQRRLVAEVSDMCQKKNLAGNKIFVNHIWFFWSNDLNKFSENYDKVTLENLRKAPINSVFIWESHYCQSGEYIVPYDSIEKNPSFVQLYHKTNSKKDFVISIFQKVTGDSASVSKAYEDFISSYSLPITYVTRGNMKLNRLRDFNGAIEDYNEALAMDKKNSDAFLYRGIAYANMKDFKNALSDFTQGILFDTNNLNLMFNRGNAQANLGMADSAIESYSNAIRMNKMWAEAYLNRAGIYYSLKQYDKAIADYTIASNLNQKNPLPFFNRGVSYLNSQKYNEAANDFSSVIALQPNTPDAFLNRGVAYLNLSRFEQAVEDCSKYISLNPNNALSYYYRGNAYIKLKNINAGCADMQRSFMMGNTEAKKVLVESCHINM